MKIPLTISNWVADAEATYGPTIGEWFPAEFDREKLCADVPEMAERLGETWRTPTASAAKARLEELATAAFRGAYLGTLALLASYDEEEDPRQALDRLTRPLGDLETELFADSFAEDVAAVESGLALDAAKRAEASERAETALGVARRLADPLRAILAPGLVSGTKAVAALGAKAKPLAAVLSGVVNVAIAVATLRYAVGVEADEEGGGGALAFDPAQLESAFRISRAADDDDDEDPDDEADDDDETDDDEEELGEDESDGDDDDVLEDSDPSDDDYAH